MDRGWSFDALWRGFLPLINKKVLFWLPSTQFGGAERVAQQLLLDLEDVDGILVAHRDLKNHFDLSPKIPRYFLEDYGCYNPYLLGLSNACRYALALREIVLKEKPDLVLAFMHNGSFFASIAQILLRFKVPLIGSIHGDISGYFNALGRRPTIWERLIIWLSTWVPSRVIVPSKGVARDLITRYQAPTSTLCVIPNGIDLEWVHYQATLSDLMPKKTLPWIVTVCRLSTQKDLLTLLMAFALVHQEVPSRLVIVGDGEMRPQVEAWIRDLDLVLDVLMVGFQDNPYPLMAKADVLVLSSFYEGFGVSIVEGFALGIPQVVTDCPSGPSDLITDGKNGFLVEIGDYESMARACLKILQHAETRNRMREASFLSGAEYSLSQMTKNYSTLLSQVMMGRKVKGQKT